MRHLLTHTSGVPEYEESDSAPVDLRHDYTEDSLVQLVARLPLDFAPADARHVLAYGEKRGGRHLRIRLLSRFMRHLQSADTHPTPFETHR